MMAAQRTRGQQLASIDKPLEKALKELQDSPEVKYHLLPLPMIGSPTKTDDPPVKRQKGKGDGKGKGKKGTGGGLQLPANCVPTTQSKQRICFQYNRKRCNHQDKPKCVRGLHVCWRQGCHGNHPEEDCNSQS